MKKIVVFILVILLPTLISAQHRRIAPSSPAESTSTTNVLKTDQEYAVYAQILGEINKSGDLENSKVFLIRDRTMVEDHSHADDIRLRQVFPEILSDTLAEFKTKNNSSSVLRRQFPIKYRYNLVSDEVLKSFEDDTGWQLFNAKYPGATGIITFSQVGFSNNGNQALVFVSTDCEGLCGEGNYYFLEYSKKKWKISGKSMTWIS
jgi:hypothetical protein